MEICLRTIFAVLFSIGKGLTYELENDFDFNRNYFGVYYWPYVKKAEAGAPVPSQNSYTFENVQTQLAVVSTKFSRIHTQTNLTYYQSYIVARTAEAAALLNRKMNKTLLTVAMGIYDTHFNDSRDMQTKVSVALEAVQIANSIHPGTITTFVLTKHDTTSLDWANSALHWLQVLRRMTFDTGLKIGTKQYCSGLSSPAPEDAAQKGIWIVRKAIIKHSDFIICAFAPPARQRGAKYSLKDLRNNIAWYLPSFQKINPRIEVMWSTAWNSDGENSWENLIDFGDYWKGMNELASENNVTLWMNGAFDSPILYGQPNGWWKLTTNSQVNNIAAYVENVSGMPVKLPTATKQSNFGDTEVNSAVKRSTQHQKTTETTENLRAYDQSRTNLSSVNLVSFNLNIHNGKSENEVEKTNEHWRLEQILVIALSLALLSVLMYFIWSKCQKKKVFAIVAKEDIDGFKHGRLNTQITQDAYNYGFGNTSALNKPYDRCLEIAKSKLEILYNQVLGGGNFGCVYKAILRNGREREVAVKMTRHGCLDSAVKGILSEIKILSFLGKHPNIVSIIGAYTAEIESGIVYLVLELCSLGSLNNHLRNLKDQDKATRNFLTNGIPIRDMIRWSHEIACGMQYLEQKDVIHADLATRNVLLTSKNIAKITDFGLARRLQEYSLYTKYQQEPLPWRWMALESLKRTEFSIKSDVWSYGVTLWDIFSFGALPFPGRSWNHQFIQELEDGSLRLGRPADATDEMYKIMLRCWKFLPEDRPSFVDLRTQTKVIVKSREKYEANMVYNPGERDLLVSFDQF